jgi:hypothetical protein
VAKKKEVAVQPSAPNGAITIPPLTIQRLQLGVVGDSPLIMHRWSEKAKAIMLGRMMKKAKAAKAARDPEADFYESMYILQDNKQRDLTKMVFGFPSVGFKSALVDAASFVDGITKVAVRGALHLVGEYVIINGLPTMREDTVRVGMGAADLRYRGEFRDWSATLDVALNPSVLSAEQIAHLANLAGFAVGVGEWRPQRDGQFGRFHVV